MFSKRFIISLFLTFLLALSSFSLTTFASESTNGDEIKVLLDGNYLQFKAPPVEIDGRTLVPLRDIFEALGATLEWDANTSTVTGTKGTQKVVLQIDNPTAYINDSPVTLSVPGTLVNEKTMVPTRFIAESMNCVVSWDEGTRTVIIVPNKTIVFGDKNIESAVKAALKTDKDKLEVADVASLQTLTVSDKKVSNLDGLQYLVNLENLDLKNNDINDIKPIASLIKLRNVNLSNNKISNINPLERLKNIITLYLDDNDIEDISSIANLNKLLTLSISKNKIKNVDALKETQRILILNIYGTLVEDLKPISSLENLKTLNLANTQITDISPLKDNKKLSSLNIIGTAVLDISPLKSLSNLTSFYYESSTKTEINDELFINNAILVSRAKSIIDTIIKPNMSDLDKELAIHDYIILHSEYDFQGYVNGSVSSDAHTPYGVLVKGVGVCDGYASSMKALLGMVNVKSYIVTGKSFDLSSMPIGHAWNLVTIEGKNYYVDLTWDDNDTKDGINRLSHDYFNISAKQILVNHKFDSDFYPAADTDSPDFDRNNDVYHHIVINDDNTYSSASGYLYKIDNKTQVATKLYSDQVSEIAYNNGWIYYINYSNSNKIYKVKTDGTENTLLSEDSAVHLYIKNNYVYYLDRKSNNHKIHRMDLDGKNNNTINYETLTSTFYFSGDKLFFKIYSIGNGSKFYSSETNGNNKVNIINSSLAGFKENSDNIQFTYAPIETIKNNYIYYINAAEGYKIYRITTQGTENKQISKNSLGSETYNYHVTGDWIYYVNSSDKKYYKVKIDGSQESVVE